MAFKPLSYLGVLATVALASTACARDHPQLVARGTAKSFRLSAEVLSNDLSPSVQGRELSYTAVDSCLSDLVFVDPGKGLAFSTDGDRIGVARYSTRHNVYAEVIVKDGGSATVPSGFPVQLQCQNGTAGASGLVLHNKGWMACPGDDGVYLAHRQEGQRSLASCANVAIVAKCNAGQDTIAGAVDVDCQ